MGRHSPSRSRHGSRRRSPPRRRSGEDRGRKEQGPVSLLVRNIPLNCSNQDLRVAFGRFGPLRDVYMPRDHHSQQARGFAFVEFADAFDASEALLRMNNHMFNGRMINVVVAVERRKGPEEMRRRTSARSNSDYEDHNTSRYGRSRSRSLSRYGGRARSRWPNGDSASPKRKEERQAKSSRQSKEHDKDKKERSCAPDNRNDCRDADNGSNKRQATPDYSAPPKGKEECQTKSPRQSKGHDSYKKLKSCTPEDINESNDRRVADNGSNDYKAYVDRAPATAKTDVEGSHPHQRSPGPSSGLRSRRRDDSSASPKRKEEGLAKSPRHSKEHDGGKKRMAYAPDDRNDRPPWKSPKPPSGSRSSRRDDHSASPKREEERLTKSPRQSKEHDGDKERMQYGPDDRNDCRDADSGHHERRDDYSSSRKIKEEHQAKSPRLSKERDKDTKQRSFIADNKNDQHDSENRSLLLNRTSIMSLARHDGEGSDSRRRSPRSSSGSRSRRQDDYSAFSKTKEERRAKSPRQSTEFDGDKKRRSYTLDDRNDCHDPDSAYNEMRDDYCAFPKSKEESQAKLPRQSKEPDEDEKRSYALDDRNDRHDADNGCNERREAPDYSASSKRKEEPRQTESWRQPKEDENSLKRSPDDRNDSRDVDNGSKEKLVAAACEGSRPRQKSPRPPAE